MVFPVMMAIPVVIPTFSLPYKGQMIFDPAYIIFFLYLSDIAIQHGGHFLWRQDSYQADIR